MEKNPEILEVIAEANVLASIRQGVITIELVEKFWNEEPKKLNAMTEKGVFESIRQGVFTIESAEKIYNENPDKLQTITQIGVLESISKGIMTIELVEKICEQNPKILNDLDAKIWSVKEYCVDIDFFIELWTQNYRAFQACFNGYSRVICKSHRY